MAIRMRVVEGQYGTVQAFVVPQTSPNTCQAAVHAVKPLCMHRRTEDSLQQQAPTTELRVTGAARTSAELCEIGDRKQLAV